MNYPNFLGNTLQFDPFQKPAKKELAIKHQLATSCGQVITNTDYCPCCGLPVQKKELSMSIRIIELSFLGQGVPLFYNQMKSIILLFFVLFCTYTVPNVIHNIIGNDCISQDNEAYQLWQTEGCFTNCPLNLDDYEIFVDLFGDCASICEHYSNICLKTSTSRVSFVNKQRQGEYKIIQSALLLGAVFLIKVAMVLIRENQRRIECACDKELLSPSDFTAMLNHLPKNNYDEKELATALQNYCKTFDAKNKYEVVKINIAYDISKFIDQSREKITLEKELEDPKISSMIRDKLKKRLDEIAKNISNIEHQIENGCYRQTTPIAFITFQTKEQLQNLLEQTKLSYWEAFMMSIKSLVRKRDIRGFYFKDNLIRIYRAPEPDDVFWENCGVDDSSKIRRKIISSVILTVLLGVSFSTLYGLDQFQNIFSNKDDFYIQAMISLSKSIIITIVNGLIYYFITLLANQERHVTKTLQDASTASKLSYVQFINSCLLLIAINIIGTYYQQITFQGNLLSNLAIQQQGGISDDILFVSGANAILVPFSVFLNPLYFYKKFKQYRIDDLNQLDANKLYEGPEVQLYQNYSYLCKTTWLTLFFAPLIPLSLFFGVMGLIAYYWIEKYLLLKRNSKPPFQSSHLDREMLSLMDLSPILMSAMQYWIDDVYESGSLCKTLNIASLALSGLELIVPTSRINRMLFKDEYAEEENVRYQDVYLKLPTDYDRTNPLTQQCAVQEFVTNKLRKRSPARLEMSQSIAFRPKNNSALQQLIYKGVWNPKMIRMKILQKKLQSVVKMRIRFSRLSIQQQYQREHKQEPELNFIEKIDSLSSYHASPTYFKTPDYNFNVKGNIPFFRQQKSDEASENSMEAPKIESAYNETPKYYLTTKRTSMLSQFSKIRPS